MKKKLLFLVVFGLVWGVVGFFWGKRVYDKTQSLFISALRSSQNGLINPLVEYEIGSGYYNKALKVFKDDVQKIVDTNIQSGKVKRVAVYFRSMNNGPWFGINEDENFFPASLLKLPLLIAYYKWGEADPTILDKEITYNPETYKLLGNFDDFQYYKPENPIEVGKTYTVNYLLEKMIVDSENNAKNLLVLNLDTSDRLYKVYSDLGIATPPELRGEGDVLSVHEYATFFRVLYNASYLSKDDSKKVLGLLTRIKFKNGIVAKLPPDVKVAHKFAEHENPDENYKQLHDCGIVYYPSYPYLVCIMSRGDNFQNLEEVIADISQTIYKEVDRQVKNGLTN